MALVGISAGERVILTNALGRIVLQSIYDGEQLAISQLPASTYMVQGERAGTRYSRRFVKL